MSGRRLILVAMVVAAALPVPARAEEARPWVGTPTRVGGTWRYDAGEWIYTDFVYDDYGADTVPTGQPNVVSLAPTVGDFRYPNGTTVAGNAADIVEVRARIAPNGTDLELRVLLQSLIDENTPAIWVVADGEESIFTARDASVDVEQNTVSFTLPGAATEDVELNLGAGLHDGSGGLRAGSPGFAQANPGAFTTGGPTANRLFDLAFNTHELEGRGGAWNENVQAAALASGLLAPFTQSIDVETLASGLGLQPRSPAGYAVRLFESRQQLGEGMAPAFPQYRGRWQPYAVWTPASYDPRVPTPLLLNMHSLSVHHNQYRGGSAPSASYKTIYEQFDHALGAIVVTPLARGPDGWYEDQALVDTLEVWADALTNYNIDRERVYVGGYSMGGYGTYRLSTMMPDAIASAFSVVGPSANGIWPYPGPPTGGASNPDFTLPQLESTRHVPYWITHGAFDELVPVTGVTRQAERLGELGHEYRYALHPAAEHFSFAFTDEWSRESSWLASHQRRVTDPHRVTLKIRPAAWATGGNATIVDHLEALTAEVGARLDGGYWVSDVHVSSGIDVTATVDLSSGGITRRQVAVEKVAGAGLDGPSPHVLTGQDKVWGDEEVTNALTGRLSGVDAITIDVGRAGLPDAPDVSGVVVSGGGPVTLTFIRAGVVVGQASLG